MEKADEIVDRLPGFYRARERNSPLYDFVSAVAKIINQQEDDLSTIMDSHWIATAHGIDLDLLASLFGLGRKRRENDREYKSRINQTFVDIKKGGTVEAVRAQLALYLATSKEDIMVEENPPIEMQDMKKVVSGDSWVMTSTSIRDEKATIVLSLEDGEARDPTIIDLDANVALKYKGTLKKGDVLELNQGKAMLNGVDATKSVSFESGNTTIPIPSDMPKIPRKPSKWIFRERLTDTLGRFDQSKFDENVFFESVPPTTLKLQWTSRLLASFEVKVSSRALEKASVTKEELEALVNAIKAAGIRTFVKVMPESDHVIAIEAKIDSSKSSQLEGKASAK